MSPQLRFPRLLALLTVLVAFAAPSLSTAEEKRPASGGRMATALQPFVDSHTLAGAVVLVATKDKVLDVEAVGYADIAAQKPMRTDSVFWIASQSKPVTATAVIWKCQSELPRLALPVSTTRANLVD